MSTHVFHTVPACLPSPATPPTTVFDISLSHVDSVPTCDMLERSLALGFKLAAESPKGLHLHSYEHHNGTASVRHILLSLPPLHLQHLHLCFEDESKLGAVVPALARLTGLTSLFLDRCAFVFVRHARFSCFSECCDGGTGHVAIPLVNNPQSLNQPCLTHSRTRPHHPLTHMCTPCSPPSLLFLLPAAAPR